MKFSVDDASVLLSHVMIQDEEAAKKIAETKAWKEDNILEAEVAVNGIPVSAQAFEDAFKHLLSEVERQVRERYDADKFDERVDEAAQAILKKHADGVLEQMEVIQNTLQNSEDLLQPHWERKRKQSAT